MDECYAPYTCIENEIRCDVCKNSTLQNVGGREEANKVSVPGGGDHAGGEQPSHAHAGDHLGQAGGLGEGEEPVGVQLAPHVVHFIGQVDEPSILVIAEHLLE